MPLSGSCNDCGACCKPPVVVDNPCFKRGDDRCLFYDDSSNTEKFGHCLILGRGETALKSVVDRSNKKITASQIKWFEANCPEFPEDCIAELTTGTFKLPPACGYIFLKAAVDG